MMSRTRSSVHSSSARSTITTTKQDRGIPSIGTPSIHGRLTPSNRSETSLIHFSELKAFAEPEIISTPLSPPVTPVVTPSARKKRSEIIGRRLKGKSGLKLNESTLRKYTDYDSYGSAQRGGNDFLTGGVWTPNTFGEPHGDIQSNLERFEDALTQPLPIFDVYALTTVMAVLKDPAAIARMRQFAEPRGHANDIDFLLQIREYAQAMESVAVILANISLKFIGVAAPDPVKLPKAVGKSLNASIRDTSNTLIPSLESTFDDSKTYVEQTLAQDLYPEFVKHQLSSNLQTIGPGYSPNQVCAGFGEAFCMSDPNQVDDPIVFASDGLGALSGYSIAEMVYKNCRFFQGQGTRRSCVERMRNSFARNDEATELVLNYTKDGRPYWNLVFMARLVGADGTVRFHLGGQIDVSEMVESEGEITHLLSYLSPLAGRTPPKPVDMAERRSSWRGVFRERRAPGDGARGRESTKYPPSTSRNKFLQGFRHRHAAPHDPSVNDSGTDLSCSEPPTPAATPGLDPRRSMGFPPAATATAQGHFETLSPYSRFMVLEYTKSARHGLFHDKKSRRIQLDIAFCSQAALDSLGWAGRKPSDIVDQNVFDALSEKAGGSVNKAFRSTVRASMAEGRPVKLDIAVGSTVPHHRPRGFSLTRKRSGADLSGNVASGCETPSRRESTVRRTLSLERLASYAGGSGPTENFISYWTPLKDGIGATQWVVVVFIPDLG